MNSFSVVSILSRLCCISWKIFLQETESRNTKNNRKLCFGKWFHIGSKPVTPQGTGSWTMSEETRVLSVNEPVDVAVWKFSAEDWIALVRLTPVRIDEVIAGFAVWVARVVLSPAKETQQITMSRLEQVRMVSEGRQDDNWAKNWCLCPMDRFPMQRRNTLPCKAGLFAHK